MEIEFDPIKSAKNARERALPFELVRELEWGKAPIGRDERRDYDEERFLAFVPKGEVLWQNPPHGLRSGPRSDLQCELRSDP